MAGTVPVVQVQAASLASFRTTIANAPQRASIVPKVLEQRVSQSVATMKQRYPSFPS